MFDLAPLEPLFEVPLGRDLPLPPALAAVYGPLEFPPHAGRPYVFGNFVQTLDGVVTLGVPGLLEGGPISGFNQHDRMIMGMLRAAADAVVIGAGTNRATRNSLWTAEHIFPPLATVYGELRVAMGKPSPAPLAVLVTRSGRLDVDQRLFQSGEMAVLVVTTSAGAAELHARGLPERVRVATVEATSNGWIGSRAILDAIRAAGPSDLVLCEGGPRLMGVLMTDGRLDELFLTIAPQVAGRIDEATRPAFVAGSLFAPDRPLWTRLASLKRGGHHLFTRYVFTPMA
ncbi:MAG TPA: dihydrofolate reductase family protein [Polyangia bacterium]|jgi:riboflavin biosynthesis pyrimidine reductase